MIAFVTFQISIYKGIMDRLSVMKTYVRVVETGSFTAVAREQGTQQPAISKQISWLEAYVGNQLIERTTRRLLFTDKALEYYEECKSIIDAVDAAERLVRNQHVELSGELRISASIGFGSFLMVPNLPIFLSEFPCLSVDLRLSDDYVDVVAEGIDIAYRIGPPGAKSLASRLLGNVHPILVASREYCKTFGRPVSIADLSLHKCIVISGRPTATQWRFEGGRDDIQTAASGPVRTNSGMGARALVLANTGIALLPRWLFEKELISGDVVQLLPDERAVPTPLHAVTPVSRRHSLKVQRFLEAFENQLAGHIEAAS
jgi:DNA-binding transcriptional LysR family regulator